LKIYRFVALYNYVNATYYSGSDQYISIGLTASSDTRIIVVSLQDDYSTTYIDGRNTPPNNTYQYSWGDILFKAKEYIVSSGYHHIYVFIYGSSDPGKPFFRETYYARDTLKIDLEQPASLAYPVSLLISRLFIAPVVYFAILLSVSMALSKLLGGSVERIARIMVSGL